MLLPAEYLQLVEKLSHFSRRLTFRGHYQVPPPWEQVQEKKLHEKLKMERGKGGRMNERGFSGHAITAARSLARLVSSYFRPPFSFVPHAVCGSFQLPSSLRSRLQGRCNLDAYARQKMGAFSSPCSPSRHEKFQVITLIILGCSVGFQLPNNNQNSLGSTERRGRHGSIASQLILARRHIRKCSAKIETRATWSVAVAVVVSRIQSALG